MNKWECGEQGCRSVAVGSGSGLGLRAIGWLVERGPKIRCPAHRPDAGTKKHPDGMCDVEGPCSICTAEQEANRIQYRIVQFLELTGEDLEYHRKQAARWDG